MFVSQKQRFSQAAQQVARVTEGPDVRDKDVMTGSSFLVQAPRPEAFLFSHLGLWA